jgi:hypothetical protein
MMNNVSIYGVQGVDPMGVQDGLMAMLLEGGEGFAAEMDSALLSTEMEGGELLATDDVVAQDGLSLLQSEFGGMLPGFTMGTQQTTMHSPVQSTVTGESLMDTGENADLDLSLLDPKETLSLEGLDLSKGVETMDLSQVQEASSVTEQAVDASMTPTKAAVETATTHMAPKAATSRKVSATSQNTEARIEEAASEREVSMESREHKLSEVSDELTEEWDSTHLQMDTEFEHVAANTPFTKAVLANSTEGRMMAQAESLDAVDADAAAEVSKDEKKAVEKVQAAPFELEEFEENPADARVELSDQRTVRVVVDQDLSVEVSQDGDAVDVLVEGAQDITNEMRDAAPEIAESLDDSGLHLRDFSTREEGKQTSHEGGQKGSPVSAEPSDADAPTVLNRGHSVNVVA